MKNIQTNQLFKRTYHSSLRYTVAQLPKLRTFFKYFYLQPNLVQFFSKKYLFKASALRLIIALICATIIWSIEYSYPAKTYSDANLSYDVSNQPTNTLFYETGGKDPATVIDAQHIDNNYLDKDINAKEGLYNSYFAISLSLIIGLGLHTTLLKTKREKKKYRVLFDLSPYPKYFIDVNDFSILEANDSAVEKFGYPEKELQSMTLFDVLNIRDDEKKFWKSRIGNVINNEGSFLEISKHYTKQGVETNVEVGIRQINAGNKKELLVIMNDIAEKEIKEKEMTIAIINAQEDERRLLGGELHDNVGQLLICTQLYMDMAAACKNDRQNEYIADAKKYLVQVTNEIRNLAHRLAPTFLEEISLAEAIAKLLKDINKSERFNIQFDYKRDILFTTVSADIKLNIYRILQEQLNNIIKYSKATTIKVALKVENQSISLSVSDNGIGFDLQKVKHGVGLLNMKKRSELLSGKFCLETSPGNGCSVSAKIPILNKGEA